VGPGLDRLGPPDGCRAGIGPGHGQGDDDQQGVELDGLGEARVLHVEAPGLAVSEEAFDLPAPAVGLEGFPAGPVAGDDQEFTLAEPLGGEAERGAQALVHGLETRRPALQELESSRLAQQGLELIATPILETNLAVLLHTDGEQNVVFQQKLYPPAADELAIGEQPGDRARTEKREIAPHQRDALTLVARPGLVEKRPHQRNAKAPGGNRQHQNVHVVPPDLPVGPVQAQDPGRPQLQELDHGQRQPVSLRPDGSGSPCGRSPGR